MEQLIQLRYVLHRKELNKRRKELGDYNLYTIIECQSSQKKIEIWGKVYSERRELVHGCHRGVKETIYHRSLSPSLYKEPPSVQIWP